MVFYNGYELNGMIMLLLLLNLVMALLALLSWESLKMYRKNNPNKLSIYMAGQEARNDFTIAAILEFILALNICCFVGFLRANLNI